MRSKMSVSLPAEDVEFVRTEGLNASALLREGIAAARATKARAEAVDALVEQLTAAYGPPTAKETADARAWAERVFGAERAESA